ncbi:MAG TPA: 3-deoxy-manno-octulosonate cytidylyltransferase [Candidatus Omnitrophota bacterium]|nr:3-deoxy-manno-octulosonate cytidylyltransferase [Candidatus Omnitrophota bacterium]HPD84989.1 3-deoxy-manno-octulosonate cytidylyltransferase [Candidatus Omnitrophota bacterium]HRZ03847.1 3-deoxy-manno-octulosonate cytidylyltransferase [Candidatus Omnitrophota bacterium]
MTAIGVIPARYGSTRLKAKVLADILGRPMIWHVWQRARKARLLDDLVIACDDQRIIEAAKSFGARAVMTSKNHASGSDRIMEAVKNLKADIVVNIQGDEPLVHPSMIDSMVGALLKDKSCPMATVIKPLDRQKDLENPNIVKAIIDKNHFAIYFSRSVIPYNRDCVGIEKIGYYKHLGLYAYRKDFLMKFKNLPQSRLEQAERLEQLRVLEAGYKIKTVETRFDTIAVDTAADLKKVEAFLRRKS